MSTQSIRKLGKNTVIEIIKRDITSASSVWSLDDTGTPVSGTFKLKLNGEITAPLDYDATSTEVQTALRALENVGDSDITVTGSSLPFTITAAGVLANRYNTLAIVESTVSGGSLALTQTTKGQGTVVLSSHASNSSFNLTVEAVDVTAGNEVEVYEKPTRTSMSYSVTLFRADQPLGDLGGAFEGLMTIYFDGKVAGSEYISFNMMSTGMNVTNPFDQAMTVELSGNRQGAMIADWGSVYAG